MDGETTPDNALKSNGHNKSKTVFKKPKGRAVRKKKAKLDLSDDEDEEEATFNEGNKENNRTPAEKSRRGRPARNSRRILSDSDSD